MRFNRDGVALFPWYQPVRLAEEDTKERLSRYKLRLKEESYPLCRKLPEQGEVVGYLYNGSENLQGIAAILTLEEAFYPIHKEKDGKVVGYLPMAESDRFAAVVVQRTSICLLPLLLIFLLVLLFWLLPKLLMIGVPLVIYSNDPVSSGAITEERPGPLETDYFNIKINATPILERGRMNLRLENSQRNILSCRVEVSILQGTEDKTIYLSPVLDPDQSLEYATVEEEIPPGVYDGTATFYYLRDGEELTTTSSVRLTLNVR